MLETFTSVRLQNWNGLNPISQHGFVPKSGESEKYTPGSPHSLFSLTIRLIMLFVSLPSVGTVAEIRNHPARRVSHQKDELLEGDVFAGICPDFGFSGAHSVWIAAYMGFSPVFLAGADCYGDYETDYWHQYPGGKEERMRHAKNDHADHWIPIAEAVKDKAEIVCFSDPLKEIFK